MTKEEALKVLDTIPTISEQVDALEMAIKALEQQPKRGKWINNPDADYGGGFFMCSECGTEFYDVGKYCPECGSDNREETDE